MNKQSSVSQLRLVHWHLFHDRGWDFFSFLSYLEQFWSALQHLTEWVISAVSLRVKRHSTMLTTHLYPVSRLRMHGAKPQTSTSLMPNVQVQEK